MGKNFSVYFHLGQEIVVLLPLLTPHSQTLFYFMRLLSQGFQVPGLEPGICSPERTPRGDRGDSDKASR